MPVVPKPLFAGYLVIKHIQQIMTTISTTQLRNRIASAWHIILIPALMCITLLALSFRSNAKNAISFDKQIEKRISLTTQIH